MLKKSAKDSVGKTQAIGSCCREVRLGAEHSELGQILTGWNTITDEYEEWEVVQVCKHDGWRTKVERIK